MSRSDIKVIAIKPHGVTGEALDIKGQQHVSFILGRRKFNHTFLVCPLPTEEDVLLGIDFLVKTATKINFDSEKLSLADDNKVPYACDIVSTKHATLTMFPQNKLENDKSLQMQREEPSSSEHSLDNPPSDKTTHCSKSWLVKVTQDITIVRRC